MKRERRKFTNDFKADVALEAIKEKSKQNNIKVRRVREDEGRA